MKNIIVLLSSVGMLFYFIKYHLLILTIKKMTKEIKNHGDQPNQLIGVLSSEKTIQQILRVINSFIDHQRELDRKSKRVENEMKNMITNISHDLRTPLAVISGYVEIMKKDIKGFSSEELVENLSKIERQSQKLIDSINNYFDFNKLNSGDMIITKEPVDVSEILKEELLSYYTEIEKQSLHLVVNIYEDPLFILGSADTVRRIITNLITNALKYGKEGNYLAVNSWKKENNVCIEITDKGKGILEENQQLIFERLTTLEDATDESYVGNGLGLAITKRLVECLNGKISLYSQPYVRTTFMIEFPLYEKLKKSD